MTVIHI